MILSDPITEKVTLFPEKLRYHASDLPTRIPLDPVGEKKQETYFSPAIARTGSGFDRYEVPVNEATVMFTGFARILEPISEEE